MAPFSSYFTSLCRPQFSLSTLHTKSIYFDRMVEKHVGSELRERPVSILLGYVHENTNVIVHGKVDRTKESKLEELFE